MPMRINIGDIAWGQPDATINLVSEEVFYKDRNRGILRPNTLPRPDGVTQWSKSVYAGEIMHTARVGNLLYMIADTQVFGYALFKFVSTDDDGTTYKATTNGSVRPISNERNDIIMANPNPLAELSQKFNGGMTQQGIQPMSLGGNPAPMAPVVGEGVSHGIGLQTLKSELRTRSYIAGYVMGNAPQLTMSLSRKKNKDGTTTANILAKESKPSRCLAVLMNLPANCVQRNGSLANPSDIAAGAVDYSSTPAGEQLKLFFSVPATIAYLSVMDNSIPEYAPHVMPGMKRQWTAEEILSESGGVTFVKLHPTMNKSRDAGVNNQYRFSLKSTSGRRSLYTENNIMCLRALEHVQVKCSSEEDEYNLNNIAFGAWEYRKKKTETQNALQRAYNDCPTQIWAKNYTINGESVPGIGSAFFFAGSTTKDGAGETISARQLTYVPWWQTGDRRETQGSRVTRLVKRTKREATEDKKEAMVTSPVLYAKDPTNKLFQPYEKFANFIIQEGYMTRDQLVGLGARTSKAKSRALQLDSAQLQSLDFFLQSADVTAAIESVQHEASDRVVIRASRNQVTSR